MPRHVSDWEMRLKAVTGLETWHRWTRQDLTRSLRAEGFTVRAAHDLTHEETGVRVYHLRTGYMISWVNPDSDRVMETVRIPREVEVPFVVDMALGLVLLLRWRMAKGIVGDEP